MKGKAAKSMFFIFSYIFKIVIHGWLQLQDSALRIRSLYFAITCLPSQPENNFTKNAHKKFNHLLIENESK